MPLFEYRCNECREQFEELVSGDLTQVRVSCPTCGSANVEKQLSVFAASGGSSSAGPTCGSGGCGSGFR